MTETSTILSHPTKELNTQEVLGILWVNRVRILVFSVGVAIVTLGINLLLPDYYRSTAVLLPETEKAKLSALSQFTNIAALAGVSIPGSEIARLYPAILTSETVLRSIIEKRYHTAKAPEPIDLIQYFDLNEPTPSENMEAALRRFREVLSAGYDAKTSLVTVSLTLGEPQLTSDVLNNLVSSLDAFMRLKRVTTASEQVKWIEVRLKQVGQDLTSSEDSLEAFRAKNRRVTDSPKLLLEQERLLRNVQVNSTVYVELKKQLELAKLEEIKNLSIVNILDPARPPALKDGPKRKTNTAISFVLALFVSSAFFIAVEKYREQIISLRTKLRNVRNEG